MEGEAAAAAKNSLTSIAAILGQLPKRDQFWKFMKEEDEVKRNLYGLSVCFCDQFRSVQFSNSSVSQVLCLFILPLCWMDRESVSPTNLTLEAVV